MFKRQKVYDLLLKTYGAQSSLRDYSGRKAEHYLLPPDDPQSWLEGQDEMDKAHMHRFSGHFLRDFIRESSRRPPKA